MTPYSSEKVVGDRYRVIRENPLYPFYKDDNAICCVIPDKYDEPILHWISSRFDVLTSVFDEDRHTIQLEINVHTRFGTNRITLDKGVFSNRRLDELCQYGINYDSKNGNLLSHYVTIAEQHAQIQRQYSGCGWDLNGEFRGFDDSYAGTMDLSMLQTVENYIPTLNKLITGSVGCQLVVAVSLSSALLALLEPYLHTGSLIVHIFGDSSEGKTTGLQLGASVWGNPEPGKGTFLSWNATDNAMLSALSGNHGIAVAFDESGAIRKRDYSNIIYCLSQGIDRARLNKDSKKKDSKLWSTIILSSGENSLLDASSQNSGLRARIVELLNLPITASASHAEELKTFAYQNYGVLGRQFLPILQQKSLTQLLKLHSRQQNALLKAVGSDKSIVKRLICVMSIILLTARIAHNRLALEVNLELLEKYLVNHLKAIDRDSLSLAQRAYEVILEWVSANSHLIQTRNDSAFSGAAAKMTSDNEIAIKSNVFKKLLADNGFSDVKVVAQALKRAGLLHPEMADGLQTRIVIGNVKVQTYRICLENNLDLATAPVNKTEPIEIDDIDLLDFSD